MVPVDSSHNFDTLLSQTFPTPLKYEFWPSLTVPSKKLLLVLHGRGDTLEGFHFLPSKLGIDELNVLFLEAPDLYYTGYSWYDLPPNQAPGILRSRSILTRLLDNIVTTCRLRYEDIYVFGFSQGCLLTLDLALRFPHKLGGFIGVSGYLFFEEEYPKAFSPLAKEQRIFLSHGYQDEVLSFEKTKSSSLQLQKWGIQLEWMELNKGHTLEEGEEIEAIRAFIRRGLDAN